jgi:hypothetical protein
MNKSVNIVLRNSFCNTLGTLHVCILKIKVSDEAAQPELEVGRIDGIPTWLDASDQQGYKQYQSVGHSLQEMACFSNHIPVIESLSGV